MVDYCEVCGRENVKLTNHHLIPKDKNSRIVSLCKPCHKQIHATFTHSELKHDYDTIKKIRESDRMQGFIKWIRRTDKKDIKVRESQKVRKWRR